METGTAGLLVPLLCLRGGLVFYLSPQKLAGPALPLSRVFGLQCVNLLLLSRKIQSQDGDIERYTPLLYHSLLTASPRNDAFRSIVTSYSIDLISLYEPRGLAISLNIIKEPGVTFTK